MYDIGKIGLPPYILTKAGSLTDDEWAMIKPTRPGASKSSDACAACLHAGVIRHHHERFTAARIP
jgi:response regulator RpfG family c-di-GMP phosphodiesterase